MKKTMKAALMAGALATAAFAASCNKKAQPGPAAPPPPPKPTLEKLLKDTPCNLENKSGVFAAFSGNTLPGQQCFALTAGPSADYKGSAVFNIEAGAITIIAHTPSSQQSKNIALVTWKADASGQPCFDKDCATTVPSDAVTYPDKANAEWTYTFITPKKQPVLTGTTQSFFGVTTGNTQERQSWLPVFN